MGFCEKQPQPLSFYMDVEGKPILMSVSMTNTFEADFVLATLIDPAGDESESQAGSQSTAKNYTASGASAGTGMSGASPSTGYLDETPFGTDGPTPSSTSHKRKSGSQLATPPAKRPRMSDGDVDEEEEEMLWGKDLQTNVIDDNDDSDDVMSS